MNSDPEVGMAKHAPPCRCGCAAEMHEHLRAGRDCGRCGRVVCPRYRPRRLEHDEFVLGGLLRRLRAKAWAALRSGHDPKGSA